MTRDLEVDAGLSFHGKVAVEAVRNWIWMSFSSKFRCALFLQFPYLRSRFVRKQAITDSRFKDLNAQQVFN